MGVPLLSWTMVVRFLSSSEVKHLRIRDSLKHPRCPLFTAEVG